MPNIQIQGSTVIMDNEFKFDIDNNIFNVFSSDTFENIKKKYNLNNCSNLNQIHSNIIKIVDENYQNNSLGDAMITKEKNIALVIKTADCIPVLLYDKEKKVIATIHSGWKGTLNNIVGNTVKDMIDKFNSNKENIAAYIYPSIKQCHFEVENDVYEQFKNKINNINKYTIKKANKYHIAMQTIIINYLYELGISNIYDSNICTYCNHTIYHSYRYNHTDKRNYLVVMIKE